MIVPVIMTEGDTATVSNGTGDGSGEGNNANLNNSSTEHDPHFEPIISLPEVAVPTMEEEEEEMIKLRARLYRFDSTETPSEWKDRGTGDVKLLRHPSKNTVRVVMRRDKTLKICANHFVMPYMELSPHCSSEKAWVWSTKADFADETPKPELLAIRFGSAENAQRWKEKFDEAKALVAKQALVGNEEDNSDSDSSDGENDLNKTIDGDESVEAASEKQATAEVTEQLEKLNVTDKENAEPSKE